jgi:hypothetical protein
MRSSPSSAWFRWFVALVWLGASLAVTPRASAEEGFATAEPFGAPNRWEPVDGASVGVSVGWRDRAASSEWLGGLWLAWPFDGALATREEPARPADEGRKAKRAPGPSKVASGPRASAPSPGPDSLAVEPTASRTVLVERPASPPRFVDERALRGLLRIDQADLVAAIDAALRAAGADARAERLDELSRRARHASALPELRLRAARSVNESASTVPTSYDPTRQTFSDGATLWLEARATWRLDRAIFASEELRLARLDAERQRDRERLEARLEDLLYGWQSAVAERLDPSASFRECRSAFVRELHLASQLDRSTRGWFSRWRAGRPPLPDSDCLALAERVER